MFVQKSPYHRPMGVIQFHGDFTHQLKEYESCKQLSESGK